VGSHRSIEKKKAQSGYVIIVVPERYSEKNSNRKRNLWGLGGSQTGFDRTGVWSKQSIRRAEGGSDLSLATVELKGGNYRGGGN